jgi:pyrimidine-nucleoside phosphorylase
VDIAEITERKQQGRALAAGEIAWAVRGFTAGEIGEAEMAALLRAIHARGMDPRETADLTSAMARSGCRLDLSGIPGVKVDKHSTGGVGDKTTLVVAPLVASAGVPVAKLSGRALGHTGGTLDKLETIPGLRTNLSPGEIISQVREIGLCIAAQTDDLCPADKKIYALRDRTGTVDSVPLIAASVMSKKIAGGADAILLDVKCGRGAFMRSREEARALAGLMVELGTAAGRRTVALVTNMDQPLGRAVGDAFEMAEAIETLHGRGPADFAEFCIALGAEMLVLGGKAASTGQATPVLRALLAEGSALARLREMVRRQGGDAGVLDDPERLTAGTQAVEAPSPERGFVTGVDARAIGEVVRALGGHGVPCGKAGVWLDKKVGDAVARGEPLARVYAPERALAADGARALAVAFEIAPQPPAPFPLILERIADTAA